MLSALCMLFAALDKAINHRFILQKCHYLRSCIAFQTECFGGFQGATCDNACPATNGFVCSGHGACADDGSCECLYNWDGDTECSTCTSGYSGSDCSLLTTTPPAGLNIASVTSSGHYLTFDGLFYAMVHQSGEFVALDTGAGTSVHVSQHDCSRGSCAHLLTVNHGSSVVKAMLSDVTAVPKIMINDVETTITNDATEAESGFTVSLVQDNEIQIEVTSSLDIKVKQVTNALMATVTAQAGTCSGSSGLFGSCNGDAADDLVGDDATMTELERAVGLVTEHAVTTSTTAMAGYAMHFSNTFAVSDLLRCV